MRQTWVLGTFLVLALTQFCGAADGWKPDPAVVKQLSEKRPNVLYDEEKVPKYELPDALTCADGSKVTTREQWSKRRAELLELFAKEMYGRFPQKPEKLSFKVVQEGANALNGTAAMKRVEVRSENRGKEHHFQFVLYTPKGTQHAPVLVLIDNRTNATTHPAMEPGHMWPVEEILARGYATAAVGVWDLAADEPKKFREGVLRLFDDGNAADAPSALGAWGWGASRVVDYLETDGSVDAKKFALIGFSRGGKCALWTGANEERFGIVYANASGCGGAALNRRRYGETVKAINDRFPHWFCDNFRKYNDRENEIPFDQHELVALIAPRAIYMAGGSEDLWTDPRGCYEAMVAASPVYALFGQQPISSDQMPDVGQQLIAGSRGFHMHAGKHDLGPFDWQKFMDFADRQWERGAPSR